MWLRLLGWIFPHMSLYSLILENHTVFMNRMRRGKLPLPKEEVEAEMFEYIIAELERAGFEHYEISNFSKPGFEVATISCTGTMLNTMASVLGHLVMSMGFAIKIMVPFVIISVQLRKAMARITEEHLSQKEQMEEEMFLGLRKKSGVSMARFEENLANL